MTYLNAVILALVQSATEFMPISSSGHLLLVQKLLGLDDVPILFDLILHLGTAAATIIVFYKIIADIAKGLWHFIASGRNRSKQSGEKASAKLFLYILISTAATAALVYPARDLLESFFRMRVRFVTLFFIVNGCLLFVTKYSQNGSRGVEGSGIFFPILVGSAQAFAALPGISRSGSTIAAGLFSGAERSFSGIYSFLISIPVIIGASIVEYVRAGRAVHSEIDAHILIIAFAVSLSFGYLALRLLMRTLAKGKLYIFSFYCFAVGAASSVIINL